MTIRASFCLLLPMLLSVAGTTQGCASSAIDDGADAADYEEAAPAATGAGTGAGAGTAADAGGATSDDAGAAPTTPAPVGAGFQLADSIPYPRFGAAAVLDTEHDRMIVHGGAGNDTWSLPLSGPLANRWQPLDLVGEHPPAHSVGFNTGPFDSAVYDPVRRSMLVCITPVTIAARTVETVELWELSLGDAPRWTRLETLGTPDSAELLGARMVLDEKQHRLLLLGGAVGRTGLWSLSLDAAPTFSRLASGPDDADPSAFDGTHSLLLDDRRDRLVLFGDLQHEGTMWAFDLTAGTWRTIGEQGLAATSFGVATLVDTAHDRILAVGGDQQLGMISAFELGDGDGTWRYHPSAQSDRWHAPSIVIDAERDRVVAFGGVVGVPLNETWTLALDTLEWSLLNTPSTPVTTEAAERCHVYDPVRDAVVSFGADRSFIRNATATTGEWPSLGVSANPPASFPAAIYDPLGEAIITFGGFVSQESRQLARLQSDESEAWETLDAGAGPSERSGHVMVYDSIGRRAIVFGGSRDTTTTPSLALSDLWALSLGANPTWTELAVSGTAPVLDGYGHHGIYDPEGHRVIVFHAGSTHALWLEGEPRWQQLETRGATPNPGDAATALLYDPDGRRLILLALDDHGTRVFALSLDESLTWHAFCPDTIVPTQSPFDHSPDAHAVLTPYGVLLTVAGASWRFDLSTAYCE